MGPAILSEDAEAIGSAVSGEESRALAESRESGSAPEDPGGSGTCSSVARVPARADVFDAIIEAISALEAGEVEVARSQLRVLVAVLQPPVTSGTDAAFGLP